MKRAQHGHATGKRQKTERSEKLSHVQERAFQVGEELEPTQQPADGFEYLRQVKWQLNRLPKVTYAAAPSETSEEAPQRRKHHLLAMPQPILDAPDALKPAEQWCDRVIAEFTELRAQLEQNAELNEQHKDEPDDTARDDTAHDEHDELPEQHNEQAWRSFCVGDGAEQRILRVTWITQRMDRITVLRVMEHHAKWFMQFTVPSLERNLSEAQSVWLYALLARVELPLDADSTALLRALLRHACVLRAKLNANSGVAEIARLNLLIVIVERFFKQRGT
jgi:survival of motor neuron protein-interacting protein 1